MNPAPARRRTSIGSTELTTGRGGLVGSLAPTVVGVAAPLDNLDRLLDGRRPPLFAIALSAISMMVWAWLWGGIISRYSGGVRPFLRGLRPLVHADADS